MSAVYFLTLRQLSGRGRILIMAVLAALPAIIATIMLQSGDAPSVQEFEKAILSAMFAGSIIPLVVLAIAAPAFANEVEDRTIANLTLSPIPRWQIVVPKLLGSITIAAPFILASALVTSYVAYLGDPVAVTAVTTSAFVSVVLYAALFLWMGLLTTQAIGAGLFYIVVWEGFLSGFISGVRMLSIRHYAIAVMHGIDPRRFASGNHIPLAAAVIVSVVVVAAFVMLAIRRVRAMDIP
jgi:ABC-2 type transport system permease protein